MINIFSKNKKVQKHLEENPIIKQLLRNNYRYEILVDDLLSCTDPNSDNYKKLMLHKFEIDKMKDLLDNKFEEELNNEKI